MILYLDIQRNQTIYHNEQGVECSPKNGPKQIVIPLKYCKVFSLKIPPVKPIELAGLIENTLPAIYPGELEEMEWDFRIHSSCCLVFIMERNLLNRVREDLGKDSRILSSALFLPDSIENEIFEFVMPDYSDLFFFKENSLDHALSIPRSESMEISSLCKDFSGRHSIPSPLEFKELPMGLFSKNKGGIRKKYGIQLAFLAAALSLLILAVLPIRQLKEQKELLQNLQRDIKNIQEQGLDENAPITDEDLNILKNEMPDDLLRVFEDLKDLLEGRGKILSFKIQGKDLQIQVRCRDGISLTNQLIELNGWESFSLEKIQRDDNGWERIVWTGELP